MLNIWEYANLTQTDPWDPDCDDDLINDYWEWANGTNPWNNDTDFEDLLDKIPTALCLFTLIYQRDQEYHRPIKKNDFNDIASLTLAIPYSDIVITDKMMVSIATRMKLDDKCDTIILKSISELEEYL